MSNRSDDRRQTNVGFDASARGKVMAEALKLVSGHPTSANFEPEVWERALVGTELEEAHRRLLESGLWLGQRLTSLRQSFPGLFDGFEIEDAIDCAVGYANSAYLINHEEFNKEKRLEGKRTGVGSTLIGHTVRKLAGTGQVISEDHLATTIVDSLSHAIFHATKSNSNVGVYPLAIRNRLSYTMGYENEAPHDRSLLSSLS